MTLAKSRLTTLLVSDKGHSYIETCLLSVGCSEDSVTTNVPTVGPTPEVTEKITGQLSYACEQWMKSNAKQEITDSTVSTSPCPAVSQRSIQVISKY